MGHGAKCGHVVGPSDAGRSAFDPNVWGAPLLHNAPSPPRPETLSQSVTVHLASPAALQQLKDALTTDKRLNVDVTREIDYYSKQSTSMTRLITVLGGFVAGVLAARPALVGSPPIYSPAPA